MIPKKKKAVKPVPKKRTAGPVWSDQAIKLDWFADTHGIGAEHVLEVFPAAAEILGLPAITPSLIKEAKSYHRYRLRQICNRPGVVLS